MKKGLLCSLLLVMALALGGPSLEASTVSLNVDVGLTVSMTNFTSGAAVAATGGSQSAYAFGNSYYPYQDTYHDLTDSLIFGTSTLTSTAAPATTYLTTTQASATYDGDSGLTSNLTMVGHGPPGNGTYPGYLQQEVYSSQSLSFTAPEAGEYLLRFTGIASGAFSLDQAAGTGYPFTNLTGYAQMYVWISSGSSYGEFPKSLLEYAHSSYPTNLPDSYTPFNTALVGGLLVNLEKEETLDFYTQTYAYQYGQTIPTPIPSAVWLLGSGLLGLLGLKRRITG